MKTFDGVSYMVNEKGQKQSVIIPMSLLHEKTFEDLYDVLVAQKQLDSESFVAFE